MSNPDVAIACSGPCVLGEGPVWDHRIGRLHWVDIRGMAILTLDPGTGHTSRWPTTEMVGFVVLTADPQVLVAGFESGLARFDLRTGQSKLIIEVEPELPGNRINDGTVAADGAILFGTTDMPHVSASGRFHRYAAGRLSTFGEPAVVTNGPAVSRDGHTVLAVDSPERVIWQHHYDNGQIGPRRMFARIPDGQGVPDGLAFDADDHVWVCHWGGGRITRFRPDGSIERVIAIPTAQVTKCAFGGPDFKTLYVTSAAYRRPLAEDPLAGALFRLIVDVPGLPAGIASL